jgi:hypothetical protein
MSATKIKSTLGQMKNQGFDDFQTPRWPVATLMNILESNKHSRDLFTDETNIWECACGKGRIVDSLTAMNYNVVSSDIKYGVDFLTTDKVQGEVIITNPPFSKKTDFLKRCYDLGRPFALLLPLTAMAGKKRIKMYQEHGAQFIIMKERIDFEYPDGTFKGKPWFNGMWVTHGFSLPKDIQWI